MKEYEMTLEFALTGLGSVCVGAIESDVWPGVTWVRCMERLGASGAGKAGPNEAIVVRWRRCSVKGDNHLCSGTLLFTELCKSNVFAIS